MTGAVLALRQKAIACHQKFSDACLDLLHLEMGADTGCADRTLLTEYHE